MVEMRTTVIRGSFDNLGWHNHLLLRLIFRFRLGGSVWVCNAWLCLLLLLQQLLLP